MIEYGQTSKFFFPPYAGLRVELTHQVKYSLNPFTYKKANIIHINKNNKTKNKHIYVLKKTKKHSKN